MHGEGFNIRQRPAHAGSGQLERAELRVVDEFASRDRAADAGADGKPKRVTRDEDHGALAFERLQGFDHGIKGRWPCDTGCCGIDGQCVVTVTTDDDICRLNNGARGGG